MDEMNIITKDKKEKIPQNVVIPAPCAKKKERFILHNENIAEKGTDDGIM